MKNILPIVSLAFMLLFLNQEARAFLPPAFYLYERISSSTEKNIPHGILLSVAKPLPGGSEEPLGNFSIPSWGATEGGWPSLSILFLNNSEQVILAVEKFGIPVLREKDLMRATREQVAAMKDPPSPFYFRDKFMFLKKFRNIFAWVHGVGPDMAKTIWAEKDTFTPIKISAPCPEKVDSLSWVKPGPNKCDLEFRNVSALRKGSFQGAKLILYKNEVPILHYSFEKLVAKGQNPGESTTSEEIRSISSILFH